MHMFVVNPRPKAKGKGTRTAAQKAATRKLVALMKARRGSGGSRAKAPAKSGKPRKSGGKRAAGTRKAASAVAFLRFNQNPKGGAPRSTGSLRGQSLVTAASSLGLGATIGAVGGGLVDAGMKVVPVRFKVGPANLAIRAAGSIGLALLLKRWPWAAKLGEGALTITLHQALREYLTVPKGLAELTEGDMQQLSTAYENNVQQLGAYETNLGAYETNLGSTDSYTSTLAGDEDY